MIDHDIELEDDSGFAFDRSARTFDLDGRLRVNDCRISKSAVNLYFGSEMPSASSLGLDPGKLYRLYRDRAALKAAAASFENVPLLREHQSVSADSPKQSITVGTVSNVRYLHPFLVADIAVWDADAIRLIESGEQRELSCGYRYEPLMVPGMVDGEEFDGRMLDIVGNHVALVSSGRAGPEVMVGDGAAFVPMHLAFPNWDRLSRR